MEPPPSSQAPRRRRRRPQAVSSPPLHLPLVTSPLEQPAAAATVWLDTPPPVARPAAGLRPLLFSSSPLLVVGIASVLLEMLPSEPPQFARAAAGRPSRYFLSFPRHTTRQLPAPASISPSSRRRFPSLLSPPAVVTVATVFGVRHHCLRYPASPLPAYIVVTASSDNRCRCRHLQQPPSLLPAGVALRRPPSSSSVAHCSPQRLPLPSPAAIATAAGEGL
ncbi:lysine-rich arabinogalactan protein 19-like [Zingiber officinale]|uniref:lysine-rich arabinogalactan protein 19-like n=1 Tax=Zingiber officinale TaxID=94328 RepID=UPI001C4D9F5F|nr:lysine-rich arabinogalactan protein 19-like [Zingiber officinale]